MQSRVSLAELIDSDVPVRPEEAVVILREVCRQFAAGDLRGIPNATVIRLTPDGGVLVEGPVSRDQDPVPAAAQLLSDLLPGFDTPTGFKVPGGLRLVLARAMRTLDLPPFTDVNDFCAALARFAAPDLGETVRGLFRSWSARRAVACASGDPHELTISDIRRARRATGLSLEEIARATGIPSWRLRELEWGYLRNWRLGDEARVELRRYARAAGLDETTVLLVAWPLLETAAAEPAAEAAAAPTEEWALVPAPADPAPPLPWRVGAVRVRPSRADLYRWALALAAAVLLAVGAVVLAWDRPAGATVAALAPSRTTVDVPLSEPAPQRTTPAVPARVNPPRSQPAPSGVRRVSYLRPATVRPAPSRARAVRPKPKPAPPPQKKSFLRRELFRIVIR